MREQQEIPKFAHFSGRLKVEALNVPRQWPIKPLLPEQAKSNLARNLNPQTTDRDTSTLVSGNTAFAVNLFRATRDAKQNSMISPYSVSVALAMVILFD